MHLLLSCIFQPDIAVRLNCKLTDTVECDNIKFPDRFIILRWISRCYQNPAFRNLMTSKGFILEKCQHCRCQGFRHTVDLINKQDSLFPACLLHTIIDRCHDLTHCVICHHHSFSTVIPFNDLRKTDGTLTGVMGNGVGYKSHTALCCRLFHNGSFADSRRTDQQQRSLTDQRISIISILILRQICTKCITDFCFCFLYVHFIIILLLII